MNAFSGGGSRRVNCSTLAGCASIRKSNASCPAREAISLRSTARKLGALGQRLVGLANDRQIGKRVAGLPAARLGTNESPLLHVAQMILAHACIPFEQLPPGCRSRTGGHRRSL